MCAKTMQQDPVRLYITRNISQTQFQRIAFVVAITDHIYRTTYHRLLISHTEISFSQTSGAHTPKLSRTHFFFCPVSATEKRIRLRFLNGQTTNTAECIKSFGAVLHVAQSKATASKRIIIFRVGLVFAQEWRVFLVMTYVVYEVVWKGCE